MVHEILETAAKTDYDFRPIVRPGHPSEHLFEEWVPHYRLKWAISRVLRPSRIIETGVRYGLSAAAFLDASPAAQYAGIGDDEPAVLAQQRSVDWSRHTTGGRNVTYQVAGQGTYLAPGPGLNELVHVNSRPDVNLVLRDLRWAIKRAKYILVDGFLSSADMALRITELLYRYRMLIQDYIVVPAYSGELLVTPAGNGRVCNEPTNSAQIKETYTSTYYLQDCGGYDAFKRDQGKVLSDARLQAVAELAATAEAGRALDLGCGRGELSIFLAGMGYDVLAVDYSEAAISLARKAVEAAAPSSRRSRIQLYRGDVNQAPFTGKYSVAVASDLIEHMAPVELERMYARIASHLSQDGIFVAHTFPNAWIYKYEHPRKERAASKIGAFIPSQPRTYYEELMHINEQTPATLRRQLHRHFEHVLLWFAGHDLADPFENLSRFYSKAEMRSAGDLFAVASHSPLNAAALLKRLSMHPLAPPIDVELRVLDAPQAVRAGSRFRVRVLLDNRCGHDLKSRSPNPVHLSYHCYSRENTLIVFDGRRTRVPVLRSGAVGEMDVEIDAPNTTGRLLFRLTLVQESVCWFDVSPVSVFADTLIEVVGGESV